jgi:hypothetical protein
MAAQTYSGEVLADLDSIFLQNEKRCEFRIKQRLISQKKNQ